MEATRPRSHRVLDVSAGRPPNLLLIVADQLGAGWLAPYGHPVVRAPTLTALARAGVVFENAYCASPLCAPSRAALLTGRLPSRTGVFDNAAELRASLPTIAHHLRAAGYATSLAGKMHFVGPDQLHGFEERLTTDIYPADLGWTPDWRRPVEERLPWYHTMESVLSPGVCSASMQLDYDDEVAFRAVRRIFDFARDATGDPFLLVVSFSNPHDPWEVRARHWQLYDRNAIDAPAVPPIPLSEADPHSRRLRRMTGVDEAGLTDEQVRIARHGYYAAISYVDERIGDLLAALHDSGLYDETTVVFTADHGEMLGERGLWYKMSFFEPSARVPLIVTAPGRIAPGRRAEPVSLLDLVPTLLELAGSGPADEELTGEMDGVSLLPLLDGRDAGRPAPVVGEYLAEGVTSPALMIRRGSHKFVSCEGDPDQLYDLSSDPLELVNLAERPAHAELRSKLRAEVADRWDTAELARRVLQSQRERRLVAEALGAGRSTKWDFQPYVDASAQYVRDRDDLYGLQRRARLDARGR
jgi:choline-sulfatase